MNNMRLEIGMYVRTTYGIGKIVSAYIVYDDGGSLWHLAYMTDNPKIEVAIYTTQYAWELFGKVQKDHRIKYEPLENNLELVEKVYKQELEDIVCYVPLDMKVPRGASLFDNHKFIKASYNIVDLIEEGDFVNDERIIKHNDKLGFYNVDLGEEYFYSIDELKIKSILTKERFEIMVYKVGE